MARGIDRLVITLAFGVQNFEQLNKTDQKLHDLQRRSMELGRSFLWVGSVLSLLGAGFLAAYVPAEKLANQMLATLVGQNMVLGDQKRSLSEIRGEWEAIRDYALDLASGRGRTPQQVYEAALWGIRAGISDAETLNPLIDISTAQSIISDVPSEDVMKTMTLMRSAWQMNGAQMRRAADQVLAISTMSRGSLEDFFAVLEKPSGLSGALDIPLEHTLAVGAAVKETIDSPQRASTMIRRILGYMLQAPDPQEAATLQRLGFQPDFLQKAFNQGGYGGVPFFKALQQLGERGTPTDLEQIFGVRAIEGVLNIIREGGKLDEWVQRLENVPEGYTGVQLKIVEDPNSIFGALILAWSQFQAFITNMGDNPAVKQIITWFLDFVDIIIKIIDKVPGLKVFLAALMTFGPVLIGLGAALVVVSKGIGFWLWLLNRTLVPIRIASALTAAARHAHLFLANALGIDTKAREINTAAVIRQSAAVRASINTAIAASAAEKGIAFTPLVIDERALRTATSRGEGLGAARFYEARMREGSMSTASGRNLGQAGRQVTGPVRGAAAGAASGIRGLTWAGAGAGLGRLLTLSFLPWPLQLAAFGLLGFGLFELLSGDGGTESLEEATQGVAPVTQQAYRPVGTQNNYTINNRNFSMNIGQQSISADAGTAADLASVTLDAQREYFRQAAAQLDSQLVGG